MWEVAQIEGRTHSDNLNKKTDRTIHESDKTECSNKHTILRENF